jgi:hypothetical protein
MDHFKGCRPDCDGSHEDVCASVVSGMDASPVLDAAEHVFDFVSLPVEELVVFDGLFSVRLWGNAGLDTLDGEGVAEPVGVVTFVAEQGFGAGKGVEHKGGPFEITQLSLCEQQDKRPSPPIADGVEFGVQPAFSAPDTLGKSPFLAGSPPCDEPLSGWRRSSPCRARPPRRTGPRKSG